MLKRSAPIWLLPCFLALCTWSTACGGRGHLDGDVYYGSRTRYRVPAPEGDGWQVLQVGTTENDLAWGHPGLDAIIQVNSSCAAGLDVPLVALTNHLLIGFTERQIQTQQPVPLDGREALVTHVVAKLDGVPRELVLTVLKKDLCVYDFALITPPGQAFATARGAYESLVAGFETVSTP